MEWYAQNMLIFARDERMREDSDLRRWYEKTNLQQLALVDLRRFVQPFLCGVRDALRLLVQATMNAARKRIRVLPGERY